MQINIKELTHIFNRKTPNEMKAVDSASATIKQGEYVGIIGQTGSGKTTFIEHLNALLLPDKGVVEWVYEDEKYNKKTKKKEKVIETFSVKPSRRKKVKKAKDIRKRIGIVFQFAEYQLFEETIEKDICFGPKSFGVKIDEAKTRAKKYLELVGLDETYLRKSPFGLSGGQKRRVALAGILAMEPDVLIADEPTAGLDPVGVREILDIFRKLNNEGKTIIIVTHDLDNVLEETKRVIVFKKGEIIRDDETYKVLKDVDFLTSNSMEPPKLLNFISKLEKKGLKIPQVKSIDELANFLNQSKKQKGGK
ncbi:energy-coupling factor transporter ATPase [Mycoplasma sp. Mirounga ES2805-ORL]|uniref:energy-coupling factor transporter ATPase n=1 Tax=Mycoplasma sp. Mirounga ES2805-ORL TaxID=754514 RepID=UPI00197BADBD|nr:energy-coupling factor transporter ATPase [Mycoplasma sp. Mirounga ES2805-ORL]QSF13721.1 energy-coupling factor transporter ATPase [Mycoplasma sp. Mirounga ES2805-ORL]